jgi:hypothetical protein
MTLTPSIVIVDPLEDDVGVIVILLVKVELVYVKVQEAKLGESVPEDKVIPDNLVSLTTMLFEVTVVVPTLFVREMS